MLIRDQVGIISAVVYGPDQRTRLGPQTRRVLFTTYAPDGIAPDSVTRHLEQLAGLVGLVAPCATTRLLRIYPGKPA
jgi:DNA/RNA-binding domain of Phe-tRNA-synthetase-like protein